MPRPPAHHHLVVAVPRRAPGQRRPERRLGIERRAVLVEHHLRQVGAQPHPPAVRRQRARQDIEERGLAHPVRPDQRHPLAPPDPDREIPHQLPPAERLRNLRRLDHQLARRRRRLELHPRRPGARDRVPPLGPEIGQPPHPPLVARPPRRDPLDRPAPLRLDQPVELVPGRVLLLEDLVAPRLEGREPPVQPPHLAAVHPERPVRQVPQERPVVAHRHERRPRRAQMRLQPADRLDVEMVGRLVEQHQVRRLGDDLRQRRPPPLPARRPRRREVGVELHPLHRHRHPPLVADRQRLPGEIPERLEPVEVRVLRHVPDGQPRPHEARPAVGLHQPGHQLHQRRLARPVPPDQRDPLPRLHRQRRADEQRIAPEGQAEVGKRQDRRFGHGRSPKTPARPGQARSEPPSRGRRPPIGRRRPAQRGRAKPTISARNDQRP